uniref:Uncharacterized protein n=1 Tax=viral metagenome TaxID=1070528 RepID=A0A6C0E1V8_9ZZZZ
MYLNSNQPNNYHSNHDSHYGSTVDKDNNNIYNYDDIIGTDNNDTRRRTDFVLQENISTKNSDCSSGQGLVTNKNSLIYRFKFTEEFMQELYTFSKIHQYDNREDFKESWTSWMNDNNVLISSEQERMISLGYHGDILEKMYKSARYYFRKKTVEKKEPVKRRNYLSVSKELLDSMDDHIRTHMFESTYQPKTGFELFCNETKEILKTAVVKICEQGITDSQMIQEKIKKTYKNRYFVIVKK